MTDRYRTKNCAYCNTPHKKRGKYCSRSCGNHRIHTPKHRQNISDIAKKYWRDNPALERREHITVNGLLALKKVHNPTDTDLQAMTLDDFMIEPQVKKLPDNQFVANGDLWTEAD